MKTAYKEVYSLKALALAAGLALFGSTGNAVAVGTEGKELTFFGVLSTSALGYAPIPQNTSCKVWLERAPAYSITGALGHDVSPYVYFFYAQDEMNSDPSTRPWPWIAGDKAVAECTGTQDGITYTGTYKATLSESTQSVDFPEGSQVPGTEIYFVLSPTTLSQTPLQSCISTYNLYTEQQLIASRNAGVQEGINTVLQKPGDYKLITDAGCGVIITEQEKLAKQAGIDQCKTNPASCALFSAADVAAKESIAKQTGIDQCKTNPASCTLFSAADVTAAKQAGIDQCKTNPASCALFSAADVTAAKQAGIDQCKTNPASCALFSAADVTAAKQAGIDQCKTNPASCALFSAADVTAAKQAGIDQCKTNPASCALFSSADVATKETAARAAGKQEGISAVQAAPNTYGLHTQSELDQRYQQGVQDGIKLGGGSVCTQAELDAAEQRGITSVTSKPNAYSLYTQAQRDAAVSESFNSGVTAVVADPEKYGITSGCSQTERDAAKSQGRSEGKSEGITAAKSSFSFVDNRLQIPLVDIQDVPQQPTCFSVEMSYLPEISTDIIVFSLTGAVLLPDCQPLPPMPN